MAVITCGTAMPQEWLNSGGTLPVSRSLISKRELLAWPFQTNFNITTQRQEK
jgi:hypothetical protein